MTAFIVAFVLISAVVFGYAIYRGVRIGRRVNRSLENYLNS